MEIKRREITLAGLFFKYIAFFCGSTILLAGAVFLMMLCAAGTGFLLPANYAEVQLSKHTEQIRAAGEEAGQWIPKGCTYGIYSSEGGWIRGDFSREEQKKAWDHYKENRIYAEYKGYYRFLPLSDGKVCIVKYHLIMRYASERLNQLLFPPEVMMPVLDISLFLLNAILLSRGFARKVKTQLQELRVITEKVAGNDLEFETGASDIREINEVMASLGRMRDTLQDSLKTQWDMEKRKQEQLSALAHDVKTPLTVIRGNAELLKENLSQRNPMADQECAEYILANTEEIEKYLESMKQILHGTGQGKEKAFMDCRRLIEALKEAAEQLAGAEKIPVIFENESAGEEAFHQLVICCSPDHILRAFSNIISNGLEHTDRKKGIEISITTRYSGEQMYLAAAVRDHGEGFSPRDLRYADQEFYSGDTSRHDRRHSGLGLSIASRFAKEQGGFLEYGNCKDGAGAVVSLWLKIGF